MSWRPGRAPGGCRCGGRLHSARYRRKPRRGLPEVLRDDREAVERRLAEIDRQLQRLGDGEKASAEARALQAERKQFQTRLSKLTWTPYRYGGAHDGYH